MAATVPVFLHRLDELFHRGKPQNPVACPMWHPGITVDREFRSNGLLNADEQVRRRIADKLVDRTKGRTLAP